MTTTIKIKIYSHKLLVSFSRSGKKPSMKLIVGSLAVLFKEKKLVNSKGNFLFVEREKDFVLEREGDEWTDVKIKKEDLEIWKALSDMSGIHIYHLIDHGLRLVRDLKIISTDNKGKTRLTNAIKALKIKTPRAKDQLKKIEKIDSEIPEIVEQVTQVRAVARDRVVSKRKVKPLIIKLELSNSQDLGVSMRHALDNSYRWTLYNVNEIREYMMEIESNLNPVTAERISFLSPYVRAELYLINYEVGKMTAQEIYKDMGADWKIPDVFVWLERYLDLWETANTYRGLSKKYYTVREWFKEMDLDLPESLEADAEMIIMNRKDLERTGIFTDLDLRIKDALKILDTIEYAYHHFDELDSWERTEARSAINSSDGFNHPYSQLLREKFERADPKK